MHVDLTTLYLLVIGTLLVGAAMTVWERKARPERRRSLDYWALGYVFLALGCIAATSRARLPGVCGAATSNLVIMTGYLLILEGTAALNGRSYRKASGALLGMIALLWAAGGTHWQGVIWAYVSAGPIALVCGATTLEMLRCQPLRHLRASRVVIAATGTYALLYAARVLVLPVLALFLGPDVLAWASALTMYGGVLYSVVLPMGLLTLMREEAHDRLLHQSLTDYLTGLGNRQWFFEEGARRLAGAPCPISLLAFDMDHFKTINDRHGHATGDEVLKVFARTAQGLLGSDAVLARIGGEEFAALLPGCDEEQARRIGQSVVQTFANTVALTACGKAVRATVSIGLAELETPAAKDTASAQRQLGALLSAADGALYAAKAGGRNRVEAAVPETFPRLSFG